MLIINLFALSRKMQRLYAMPSTTVSLSYPAVARQRFSTFSLPLDPMVLVRRTEGHSLEELRLIKIHLELIPEGTKWISILQRKDKCSFSTHAVSEGQTSQDPGVPS